MRRKRKNNKEAQMNIRKTPEAYRDFDHYNL